VSIIVFKVRRKRVATVLAVGLDDRLQSALASVGELKIAAAGDASSVELVGLGAAAILRGRVEPWCNLRRDQLAPSDRLRPVRRALSACLAGFLALMVALIAAPNWRAMRHEALAQRCRDDQAEVFRRLHPGRPVPTAVHWRLESEARRLGGLRGASAEAPQRLSALEILREVFSRLPGEVPLRVLELRIEPSGFLIEGECRAHADAERVAAGLGKGGLLDVDPPKTERLPKKGVSFTLNGKVAGPKEEAPPP
jgi:hypothetical protein